jgi:DNA-directed RNA polymerase specialized sigma24 family protein
VTHQTDDGSTGGDADMPVRSGRSAAVRRLRALSDAVLVDAMRAGDELAWGEFVDRFRPLLEHFAQRTGIPRWEWDTCIAEVLADEALKLASTRQLALPASLGAYLVRAVRNRHLRLKRAAARRDRHYASASDASAAGSARQIVASLCSESAIRASEGPASDETGASSGLARLAATLREELSEDELLLLTWRGAGVPHRQAAEWLGITYDAAAKRVARISQRLRAIAQLRAATFPSEEQPELERFFRRVGVTPAATETARRSAR